MKALKRPSAAVEDCFMKNDTVIGTIGNTHGVISMANPHRMASMIKAHRDPSLSLLSPDAIPASSDEEASSDLVSMVTSSEDALAAGTAAASGTENSHDSGAAQNLSLHPLHETSPVIVASLPVSLTL